MLKSELVQKLAEKNPHLYHQDLERLVNIVLNEIIGALKDAGRVELRGFGAFSIKSRDGRVGRNPRTGAPVVVEPKLAPCFRTSRDLLERMSGDPPRLTPQTSSEPITS
jgi:integration host factor subunit beta